MQDTRTPQTDVRTEIIDAAEQRFQHYGYGKTTMAEIAKDAGMSAANLYRYFENKHDIACACADRCLGTRIELLRTVVRDPHPSASDQLRRLVLAGLHYAYEQSSNHPQLNELVESVSRESPELVHEKLATEQALIAELLAQGNRSGEFTVADIVTTAGAVTFTLLPFKLPMLLAMQPLDAFEQMANDVVKLLLRGLSAR